jgi:hypothetical protein
MEQHRFHPRHNGTRPTQTRSRDALDEAHEPQQDPEIYPLLPQLHMYYILPPLHHSSLDTVSTRSRTLEPSPQPQMLEPISHNQLFHLHQL